MQEVVQRLSEQMVHQGHDVTVVCSQHSGRNFEILNGVKIVSFAISGNIVNGIRGESKAYQAYLLEQNYDVISNFAAQQWASDLMFPLLTKINAVKIFVPTGFSGLHVLGYKDYFENMKNWMKAYDMSIFLSDSYRDIDYARKNGIEKRLIIPNGASYAEFSEQTEIDCRAELGIAKDSFLIIHIGSHTGCKGHREAIEIFNKARLKNVTLLILGDYLSPTSEIVPERAVGLLPKLKNLVKRLLGKPLQNCPWICTVAEELFNNKKHNIRNKKKVLIREMGRRHTVALLKESALFLFPSNIECSPIVLFEAMAAKTAFISSDVGNVKEIVQWTGGGVVAKTVINKFGFSKISIRDVVKKLEMLYHDPGRLLELAESGFESWKKNYTWENISNMYLDVYKSKLQTQRETNDIS